MKTNKIFAIFVMLIFLVSTSFALTEAEKTKQREEVYKKQAETIAKVINGFYKNDKLSKEFFESYGSKNIPKEVMPFVKDICSKKYGINLDKLPTTKYLQEIKEKKIEESKKAATETKTKLQIQQKQINDLKEKIKKAKEKPKSTSAVPSSKCKTIASSAKKKVFAFEVTPARTDVKTYVQTCKSEADYEANMKFFRDNNVG